MHDKVVLKVYLRFATGLLLSPLWTPFLHVRGPPESDGVGVSLCESGFLIQQLSVDEAYISSRCLNVHSNSIYVSQSNIDGPLSSLSAWGLQVRFSLHFSSILVGPMARFRLIERPLNWTYSSVLNEVPVQFHSVRTLKRTVILEKKLNSQRNPSATLTTYPFHPVPWTSILIRVMRKASRCRAAWNMSCDREEECQFAGGYTWLQNIYYAFYTASMKQTLIKHRSQAVPLFMKELLWARVAKTVKLQRKCKYSLVWTACDVFSGFSSYTPQSLHIGVFKQNFRLETSPYRFNTSSDGRTVIFLKTDRDSEAIVRYCTYRDWYYQGQWYSNG